MLVKIFEKCPEKSTQPVAFVDRFVIGVEYLMRQCGILFDKLIQIFIFSLLLEKLILRVTFLGDAFEKVSNMRLLLKHFPDGIDVLSCKILPNVCQLLVKVEKFRL